MNAQHRTLSELEAGLASVLASPRDEGFVQLIVRRPSVNQREVIDTAELSLTDGLIGDNWRTRGGWNTPDGAPHPEMQLTLMNSRLIALVAGAPDRWPLAGDQLYVDFDLSVSNLPPGAQLTIGTAVIEITAEPHTGCRKFSSRFGKDAVKLVNSQQGKALRLRGVNAKVVRPGLVRVNDLVQKNAAHTAPK